MRRLAYISFLLLWGIGISGQENPKVLDAFAYFEKGSYSAAIELFDELALEQSSSRVKYQFYNGLAAYNAGSIGVAEEEFKKALAGGNTEANLWLAKVCIRNNELEKAIVFLQKYLQSPNTFLIDAVKMDADFRSLHGTDQWFMLWQDENLRPEQIVISDAYYFLKHQQFAQAHEILDRQIADNSPVAELYALNSKVYDEQDNQQLAIAEINHALQIDEENTEYLFLKASYLQKLNRNSYAIEVLNEVIDLAPENFSARYKRAIIAFEDGQFDLAKSDLEILTSYFRNSAYEFLLGKTDYELGNYISALKTFNRIMENEKPRAEYYKYRGMTLYQSRIYDQAAYNLSMSLDITPDDAETNLYLGLSEKNIGNSTMACYYLQRARNYGSTEAADYLQRFCK